MTDPDTDDAALAHQGELECRQYQEMQANDPGYARWLEQFNQQEYDNAESK